MSHTLPPIPRTLRVTLVCAPAPRVVLEETLNLAEGTRLREAVQASTLVAVLAREHPTLAWMTLTPAVWGRKAAWERRLRDLDRIELCRPLRVDPKVARRERFVRQGARATGLFARRRTGAKAGY